jgi:hypothetical protein
MLSSTSTQLMVAGVSLDGHQRVRRQVAADLFVHTQDNPRKIACLSLEQNHP